MLIVNHAARLINDVFLSFLDFYITFVSINISNNDLMVDYIATSLLLYSSWKHAYIILTPLNPSFI